MFLKCTLLINAPVPREKDVNMHIMVGAGLERSLETLKAGVGALQLLQFPN